ncbi:MULTISPECIES: hypothetical protein [unclassified Undibacterium]|uniref:hypothetical protein n=1 Tax=unclassified Undibacterium TaxID=2630295 RepID=UPI002AC9A487|nr:MULTISPECIES: hypothetical protein [unclassified Undibacterium]MEB0140998.1 hypothetical protein [Undibacterium sp. CCC2.1]MEB0173996.1 hypothetical protein [Undibacterium sp. CCC1.1]MEB0177918.1 hypothetical protein [Undibacterium sp. CCC3.4]MEB0217198.1 hypothetical protein [Undibacterium sp. 5I2]WPX42174.1 hypothetical protein RHM61_12250 [Undibacterium sp. CCC3.4]
MSALNKQTLQALASKYIWWKSASEAASMPERLIAQVMNIGDYADVELLTAQIDQTVLRDVLLHAQAGQFNERSWAYWHYRLGICEQGQVPALPVRKFV